MNARFCGVDVGLISFEQDGKHHKHNEPLSFADASCFEIFNFPLVAGVNELATSKTAVVTERIAKKWFGDDNGVGKTVRFDNTIDFQVTGVLKDLPDKTDLRSEIFFSYANVNKDGQIRNLTDLPDLVDRGGRISNRFVVNLSGFAEKESI